MHEWLKWIQDGKSLYLNKEKVQNLIAQQRINLADVSYLDLNSIDNIIKDFQNANDDLQFSRKRIFTGSAASYDKPSLQYVGSGEGAQVYGWGLYGSESEKVARWYAAYIGSRPKITFCSADFCGSNIYPTLWIEPIFPDEPPNRACFLLSGWI